MPPSMVVVLPGHIRAEPTTIVSFPPSAETVYEAPPAEMSITSAAAVPVELVLLGEPTNPARFDVVSMISRPTRLTAGILSGCRRSISWVG